MSFNYKSWKFIHVSKETQNAKNKLCIITFAQYDYAYCRLQLCIDSQNFDALTGFWHTIT